MFEYDLTGKEVILSLDPDFLPHLKFGGIAGTPLFALVHKMEESGLWLDAKRFPLCPVGIPKLYSATGDEFCHAHIFVPARAVISVVTFPAGVAGLAEDPNLNQIGFKPKRTRVPARRAPFPTRMRAPTRRSPAAVRALARRSGTCGCRSSAACCAAARARRSREVGTRGGSNSATCAASLVRTCARARARTHVRTQYVPQ